MKEILILILLCIIGTGYIFLIIGIVRYNRKKLEEQEDERLTKIQLTKAKIERDKIEQQKIFEEEQKKRTFCPICGSCSLGEMFCIDCLTRSKILSREMALNSLKNYEDLNSYKENLMCNIIIAETDFEKETNSYKLLATGEYLTQNYHDKKAIKKIHIFLKDVSETYKDNKEKLFKTYQLKVTQKNEKNLTTDYRTSHEKPYRCDDGDYVRSKAEREIDNFLYNNRIWHIYENLYIDDKTGQKYFPDFYLPDHGAYIEYFGLNDEKYKEKMNKKIKMFNSDPKIKFEYITSKDDANIKDKLTNICKNLNIKIN